ncbi:MAG: glycerol kinase GlpK [Clostridiaceae bacterium]|nr:glycerol kinase GlpK [Clostridiaceae bacterium]
MRKFILSLDQGTTSSRAILFDLQCNIAGSKQYEFQQIYPKAGYVEHNPSDILGSQIKAAADVLSSLKVQPKEVAAIGITNQRETTIVWEKATGKPVHNAIVWQCRRTAPLCEELVKKGLENHVKETTGLIIDAYFSATKIRYILDNIPNGQERAEKGELLFGTVDSWLIWNLTGRHATDYSNAARTMLFNIHTLDYDDALLSQLNIPRCMLPEVLPSSHVFGEVKSGIQGLEALAGVPVAGVAGDQQAALFGQACFSPGQAKCTYGTGSFLMMQTWDKPVNSQNRLLTTIAWGINNEIWYALEGSVFNAGSTIRWLKNELGLISSDSEIDALAESVKDSGGAYFVSAFTGLGAPYWDMYARGTMVGITRATNKAQICRAVLDGIAYQIYALARTMEEDSGCILSEIKADGGASVSNVMLQFQSDILEIPVNRAKCVESTALGASLLAGLAIGVFKDLDDIKRRWESERVFIPKMEDKQRKIYIDGWNRAVLRALKWEEN